MANYRYCPHYNEVLNVLSLGKDLDDISYEIDDIQNCEECKKDPNSYFCTLWFNLTLVGDLEPQLGLSEAKNTIDALDERIERIAMALVKGIKK